MFKKRNRIQIILSILSNMRAILKLHLFLPFLIIDMLLHPVVKNKYVYFCSALDFS